MEFPAELLLLVTLISPIIIGLSEVAKQTVRIPKNMIPVIAILIGVFVGIATAPFTTVDIYIRIWAGAIAGLTSVGLYESGKTRNGHTKE